MFARSSIGLPNALLTAPFAGLMLLKPPSHDYKTVAMIVVSHPKADTFEEELRQMLFKTRRGNTYRTLFVIRKFAVHVVAVRGTGQDLVTPDELGDLP